MFYTSEKLSNDDCPKSVSFSIILENTYLINVHLG